ncbi:MAG: pantoate--beta-alanine ligase [Pseudomonadota bacterium]
MKIVKTIADVRIARWRDADSTWGLVPTMGFLHDGHMSLVHRARQENTHVGVSIFVNPTQFENTGDLDAYPTDLTRDLALLADAQVDVVWVPAPEVVYPAGFQTYIDVEEVTRPLEGQSRAGHFRGVATVVAKLFNVFQPTRAYFGQKDAQQALTIQRMVEDLNFNLSVVICETVRETDGLAMSSRNVRLRLRDREQAAALYAGLRAAQAQYSHGERRAEVLRECVRASLSCTDVTEIDYVSVADPVTLTELDQVGASGALVSVAAWFGDVRLIDNLRV